MHSNDIRTSRISSSQTFISILQRTLMVRMFVMFHEKFNCFLSIHWCLYPLGKKQGDRKGAPLLYTIGWLARLVYSRGGVCPRPHHWSPPSLDVKVSR